MDIKIFKIHEDAIIPTQSTEGSVGFDVYSLEDYELTPGEVTLVRTGLVVQVPEYMYCTLHMRSGVSVRNCISLINDVGVIDSDYCGSEDEIKFALFKQLEFNDVFNMIFSSQQNLDITRLLEYTSIKKHDRIGQIIFHKKVNGIRLIEHPKKDIETFSRGGFGSTGK